jgi:hypothetical protein
VFVPEGSEVDATRASGAYDEVYRFLTSAGFSPLPANGG